MTATMDSTDGLFRLDHIAIAVESAAEVGSVLVGHLGGRRYLAGPGIGFRFWQWEYQRGGKIEILEPAGLPGGFLHRFLASRGRGIHHVTFKVRDIDAAMRRAAAMGYEVVGYSDAFPGWKEAFLHPKQAQGIVVQLAWSDPALDAAEREASEAAIFPAAPERRGEPADVLGPRLIARAADRARQLWEETLAGTCIVDGTHLTFHWPASALRIAVRVDPDAPVEGPVGIEIVAGSMVESPSGAAASAGLAAGTAPDPPQRIPVLGTSFFPLREPVAGTAR